MPELAEVEFYRKQWNAGLSQKVSTVELHGDKRIFYGVDAAELQSAITGATYLNSQAHGKQMLFQFSNDAWLGIHLGMSGKLRCEPSTFISGKHDHLSLRQSRQV